MRQTVSVYDFRDAFHRMDRKDQFSYEGLGALYEYLEECDPDMELDVIAICCDFTQCSLSEFEHSYSESLEIYFDTPEEDKKQIIIDYIESNGCWYALVEDDQEIVFQNF